MNNLAIIYNESNKEKMFYEKESLEFNHLKFDFIKESELKDHHKIVVCDGTIHSTFNNKKIVLIIDNVTSKIYNKDNIILIQYSSETVRKVLSTFYDLDKIPYVELNVMPLQKADIEPLDSQDSTIFYQGKDDKEDMVDEMFKLDMETHYEIKFYNEESKEEPSLLHKLSWCVSKSPNRAGIIHYNIINEIKNGCLPILIKEYSPDCFFAYPFMVTLLELNEKDLLVERMKEISSFISKMSREEFKMLANSIYNGIYTSSNWKYNNYLITEKIKYTLDNL